MEDCLFCKIADGQIPSTKVHETKNILAFEDINPQAPVHVLVIPKKHVTNINDLDKKDMEIVPEIMEAIKQVASNKELADSGYRVIVNNGSGAGQEVFHLHFHVLGGKPLGPLVQP
jgi:histidine triad (HIT) family protein